MEQKYTINQQREIDLGKEAGLDISIYQDPAFLSMQMQEIRIGMEEKLPVQYYASVEFDWFQMREIRIGLEQEVDVSMYASSDIPYLNMRQIREGLLAGIDLTKFKSLPYGVLREIRRAARDHISIAEYIHEGYNEAQLREIRLAKLDQIPIEPYLNIRLPGQAIAEIATALSRHLDVEVLLMEDLDWRQIRELRLGLEKRLPVGIYAKPLYNWHQMREIRLGLEAGIDVSSYANLMYPELDMKEKREALMAPLEVEEEKEEETSNLFVYDEYTVMLDDTQMSAYILVDAERRPESKENILNTLKSTGVTFGIIEEKIDGILAGTETGEMVLVARGEDSTTGADGYYEYCFDTEISYKPLLLEDGSVDYQNAKWFEEVRTGDQIAIYHPATMGAEGSTVTGRKFPGKKGTDLPMLRGSGFEVDSDQVTYYASKSGKIELVKDEIRITEIMMLDEVTKVTGAVNFLGTVHVRGDVLAGAKISAGRDIIVDGTVEGAELEAEGDVVLRLGCNASHQGRIRAKGDVKAKFLESCNITTEGSVFATSILNSFVTAKQTVVTNGKRGLISGGRVVAGNLIQTATLGNLGGGRTFVILDGKKRLMMKLNEYQRRHLDFDRELRTLSATFEQLLPKKGEPVDPATLQSLKKMEACIKAKRAELEETEEKIERKQNEIREYGLSDIVVSLTVYEGVTVQIGDNRWASQELNNVIITERGNRISIIDPTKKD